ncbi:Pre-rRNA-processing protein TSR1 isoform 1 [Hibiscus syriacus]|uniref:Pre-rRNA-processing protein TSR1 isoform 1 n=1 Tax=Hibiscus syriacus TaxID=106335 RepID=A0A6A2YM78_HIBSY|nr:Pre-rRNA-processing protein TSR1 isoform 1 [Hibiscus syriacus]
MVTEVEIVSKELIKPSSPTPHHLRTHLLSFLDQFLPSIYVPIVLFYMNQETSIPPADIIPRRARLLKESLSETLTLFYPFAGRIEDHHLSVDCNDEGAYYVEARVNRPLGEFLKLTDSSYVPQLLPATSAGGYVAMIQVTSFACGGVVVGTRLSHMVVNGTSITTFLRSWASLTRKSDDEAVLPDFNASVVFPQNTAFSKEATSTLMTTFLKERTCRITRIVFDASAIASLEARTASSSVPNPTRVEVVSALLSKCIMAALISKSALINHTVNLRQRTVPQIPKTSVGNFLCVAAALVTENETELDSLVCLLRKAIRKIDGDFVASLRGDGGWLKFFEYMKEIGKPTWVCKACAESEAAIQNTVLLMDTDLENGVEALVFMKEQHMIMLEKNEELLAFGTLGKSPLSLMI